MDRAKAIIRPAARRDVDALLDLYQHLTPGDARVATDDGVTILERLDTFPGSAVLVAEVGTAVVASCTLIVVPNLTRGGRPYGLIENVVTHGDYRKRGYGTQLLLMATEAAWRAGCYKVMLLTGSDSPATLNFYRNAGFEQSKTGFQVRRIPSR